MRNNFSIVILAIFLKYLFIHAILITNLNTDVVASMLSLLQKIKSRKIKLTFILLIGLTSQVSNCFASFIETTMGAAVVNDATAAYFNPAALVMLNNPQLIPLITASRFRTQFTGQTTAVGTGFTQVGSSSSTTDYYSPNFYAGLPVNDRVTLGFAAISNYANRDPESSAILRYVQSSNNIQDYDLVPAIGFKINEYFSIGASVNFSYLDFTLHPIIGFPGTNIPDGESSNQTSGSGVGASAGVLVKPLQNTLMGFDYRSRTTYRESGTSSFSGATSITSNDYHFQLHTPPRSTLSVSQRLNDTVALISTIQRIQWSVTRNINAYNLATAAGPTPVIVNSSIPQYLHNAWVVTVGANYKFYPSWIARIAATYNESPHSGYYQISTGDSYILGGSLGWTINKIVTLDGSYAHAFIQNQQIDINGNRFLINGTNRGSRDVVTLKVTVNV